MQDSPLTPCRQLLPLGLGSVRVPSCEDDLMTFQGVAVSIQPHGVGVPQMNVSEQLRLPQRLARRRESAKAQFAYFADPRRFAGWCGPTR